MDISDKVRVISDNECYDNFRDLTLIIIHKATNTYQHPGYDESMGGMPLFDFKGEHGEDIPCSLYEYEIEEV